MRPGSVRRPLAATGLAVVFAIVGVVACAFGVVLLSSAGQPGLEEFARGNGIEPGALRANLLTLFALQVAVGACDLANALAFLRARRWAFYLTFALAAPNATVYPTGVPPWAIPLAGLPVAGIVLAILSLYLVTRPGVRAYLAAGTRAERASELSPGSP